MVFGVLACSESILPPQLPENVDCNTLTLDYAECLGKHLASQATSFELIIPSCKDILVRRDKVCNAGRDSGVPFQDVVDLGVDSGEVNGEMGVRGDSSVDAGEVNGDMGVQSDSSVDGAVQGDLGMPVDAGEEVDASIMMEDDQEIPEVVEDMEVEQPLRVPPEYQGDIDGLVGFIDDNNNCLDNFRVYREYMSTFFSHFRNALTTLPVSYTNDCANFHIMFDHTLMGVDSSYENVSRNGCLLVGNQYKIIPSTMMVPELSSLPIKMHVFYILDQDVAGDPFVIRMRERIEDGDLVVYVRFEYSSGRRQATSNNCSR